MPVDHCLWSNVYSAFFALFLHLSGLVHLLSYLFILHLYPKGGVVAASKDRFKNTK